MKSIKLKTNTLFLIAALLVSHLGFSQDKQDDELSRKEKIKRLKIAFITKELDLTVDQSEKFWPVYNELESKVEDEKKARRKTAKELKENLETLSSGS